MFLWVNRSAEPRIADDVVGNRCDIVRIGPLVVLSPLQLCGDFTGRINAFGTNINPRTLGKNNETDMFVAKLNSAGNKVWLNNGGGPRANTDEFSGDESDSSLEDTAQAIAVDAIGDAYVAGRTTGKWAAGPSAVVLDINGPWVYGFLINNVWSFAGDEDRNDVNLFTLQYFVNYNLPDGWYLTTSPIVTSNWEADSGDQWTVPVGGGIGKLTRFGMLPVNLTAQAYYNAGRPEL